MTETIYFKRPTEQSYFQRGHGSPVAAEPSWPEVWGISGTAALYRRAALHSVAVRDEIVDGRFFAYYEDVELSARLRSANCSPRLPSRIPAATVVVRTILSGGTAVVAREDA